MLVALDACPRRSAAEGGLTQKGTTRPARTTAEIHRCSKFDLLLTTSSRCSGK
jgi:hypothetical protein